MNPAQHGEPFLIGDGYARIGEGSGSTNMLAGSGVDEAWTTGVQLAESVIELLRDGKPFTKEILAATYEARRRASWVERGAREAEECAQRFSRRSRPRHDRHGAGRTHRRKTLARTPTSRRPTSRFNQTRSRSKEDLKRKQAAELAIRGWPSAARCADDGARMA